MSRGLRKFCFGFSAKRGSDGKPEGHVAIKIRARNAYEMLGLKKPNRPQHIRG